MSTANHVLVPLAAGFEEIEAITIVDVLRRADVRVTIAGLESGPVTGSHGIAVETDAVLGEIDRASITAIVLWNYNRSVKKRPRSGTSRGCF